MYSTAVIEGMGFGLRTFIYSVGYYAMMLSLIDEGYASLVGDAQELITALDSDDTGLSKENVFWKMDSVNNLRKVIDKALSDC